MSVVAVIDRRRGRDARPAPRLRGDPPRLGRGRRAARAANATGRSRWTSAATATRRTARPIGFAACVADVARRRARALRAVRLLAGRARWRCTSRSPQPERVTRLVLVATHGRHRGRRRARAGAAPTTSAGRGDRARHDRRVRRPLDGASRCSPGRPPRRAAAWRADLAAQRPARAGRRAARHRRRARWRRCGTASASCACRSR